MDEIHQSAKDAAQGLRNFQNRVSEDIDLERKERKEADKDLKKEIGRQERRTTQLKERMKKLKAGNGKNDDDDDNPLLDDDEEME